MRRLIVSKAARPRGQRLIHWRYVVYARRVDLRPYRLWLWSHAAAYRELNRRARAASRSSRAARAQQLRKIAYIRRTAWIRAAQWTADGTRVSGQEGGFVGWNREE